VEIAAASRMPLFIVPRIDWKGGTAAVSELAGSACDESEEIGEGRYERGVVDPRPAARNAAAGRPR